VGFLAPGHNLVRGRRTIQSTDHLTKRAHAIEREIDDISEKHWFRVSGLSGHSFMNDALDD